MSIKRVLALTGIRSDYDLMSELYKKINADEGLDFCLVVAGAHLSYRYGYSVQNIEKDKLPILMKIESLLDSDSPASRLKSASIILQGGIDVIANWNPDLILFAGDREDVIIAALIGAYLKIPTVHFFGGDHAADGNVDNPVRHAASKLSTVHFVAHEMHAKRLRAIGEPENRIFTTGSPALDKFSREPQLKKKNLLKILGKEYVERYALMIFHPILGYEDQAGDFMEEILIALKKEELFAFVSYPNTDAGNKKIIEVMERHAGDPSFSFYKNLERNLFVNLMRYADFMIGNSSAGLYEAASIPLGAVNVGERQRGRLAAGNVIFVDQGIENIRRGIRTVLSESFRKNLLTVKSPFGEGGSSETALRLIKEIDFNSLIAKYEDPLVNS